MLLRSQDFAVSERGYLMARRLEWDVTEMGDGRNAAPVTHENQDLCSLWGVMTNGLVEINPGLVQRVAHQIRPTAADRQCLCAVALLSNRH